MNTDGFTVQRSKGREYFCQKLGKSITNLSTINVNKPLIKISRINTMHDDCIIYMYVHVTKIITIWTSCILLRIKLNILDFVLRMIVPLVYNSG